MNESLLCLVLMIAVSTCWFAAGSLQAGDQWSLASPDGRLSATVRLADLGGTAGYASAKRLYYRVEYGPEGARTTILDWSPLGITRRDQAFVDGLTFASSSPVTTIDESYTLVHGKRRECRNHARRQVLTFRNAHQEPVEVILRIHDDGAAFRYRFPGTSPAALVVTGEATGFRVPPGTKAWVMPYDEPTMYTPAYENYYRNGAEAGATSPTSAGWALPALFRIGSGHWALLAEAAVDGAYCGCRLRREAPGGLYRIRFPDPGEGGGVGAVEPSSKLPWLTPWRVVMVGDSLGDIVESTLVTNLNPPSAVDETDWVHPGRVAWSWWSDHDSPRDYEKQCKFIDLAAEMGWEYYLVDANWTLMDGGNVRELVRYAESKGVGVFLWYNSGGEHNIVTEKPRGCLRLAKVRQFEFELVKKWGVKGLKVDFFQSDKQDIMAYYNDILADAAKHQLMINFHGCTVPRGWTRTWPNLMSMEAVKGAECYTFAPDYPEKAPWHNTILACTRNVVGPMDYTPCAFSDDANPHVTTNAHELALSVVFESGLLHFADSVKAYRDLPAAPKQFLRDVPAAWDDIRFIDGEPGKFIILARRKAAAWYVGGISGENAPRTVKVPLSFLESPHCNAKLIGDGDGDRRFRSATLQVTPASAVEVDLRARGGFVMQIVPAG